MSYNELIIYTQNYNKNMFELFKYLTRVMIYYVSPKYDHRKLPDLKSFIRLDGENIEDIKPPASVINAAWEKAINDFSSTMQEDIANTDELNILYDKLAPL